MKSISKNRSTIAYSFKQLIDKQNEKYKNETLTKGKELIASKLICDPEISKDLLDIYNNMNDKDKISNYYAFEKYYHILQYSLPAKENLKYYNTLKVINPQKKEQNITFQYLTINDPINNFKNIYSKYSVLLKEINDLNKTKINLEIVMKFIDDMLKVYDVNLENYYYPPREEYPTYVYNFYSFSFFKTLKKFSKKKSKSLFKINNEQKAQEYNESEWTEINYNIGLFFKQANILFEKFNYNNIHKDLKILKIILHYFKSFEYTRNYHSNGETFKKIINCLNTDSITSDILKRFEFYRKNETQIKEEDWDSIGINENVYIKYPIKLRVKIKYFNKNILDFDDVNLLYALDTCSIEYLNIDGITQNFIIKFSPEIEKYSKKLLKSILSSKKYIDKYAQRFNSSNSIKSLLEDIFNGPNSDLIFEEIWDNVFFVPFLGKEFSGYNSRDQYPIFINYNPEFNFNTTFQKIIPVYHSQMNTLFHGFTHNIALIIATNLECDNFEAKEIIDGPELQELIDLQNIYFKKYNQNNKIYTSFDDFGDLMEVEMYGIKPRKFKTFSSLFCLDFNSYSLEPNEFREKCVQLYNLDINNNIKNDISENLKEENKIEEKCDIKDILDGMLSSEISRLLCDYFEFDGDLKNEIYIEEGKPREISFNSIYNEEISVDIDYCDKLD